MILRVSKHKGHSVIDPAVHLHLSKAEITLSSRQLMLRHRRGTISKSAYQILRRQLIQEEQNLSQFN